MQQENKKGTTCMIVFTCSAVPYFHEPSSAVSIAAFERLRAFTYLTVSFQRAMPAKKSKIPKIRESGNAAIGGAV